MNKGREEVNNNDPKQELLRTKTIETVRYYHEENKDVHEERRLRIEELDEWREHKPRTHDKPKLRKNKLDTSPNQLKVGDIVLLDDVDPHIVTTTPNEEIPLTILSIFPFGRVEVSHPKFGTFKHTQPGTRACLKPWPNRGRTTIVQYGRVEAEHDFPKTQGAINPHGRATWPWVNLIGDHGSARDKARFCFFDTGVRHTRATQPCTTIHRGKKAVVPPSKRRKGLGSSSVLMTNNDEPGTIHFQLGSLVRAMSVLEFGIALGLYTDEFMEEEDMNALPHNIHISPSLCWKDLAPLSLTYGPSRSKASALPPSLRYLHAILAHTLIGRRESTGVVTTHDAYYLWCMANAHVTDLAYFIAFAIRHQTERHRKGTLRPPQHRGPVINAYPDRSDVPTGHHDYVTHEDDRAPTWDRSSSKIYEHEVINASLWDKD
ncbi:hypothetical protein GOBAR_AA32569 [Gossypium barbadense]|uniref:Uncharacterized protein n=1 Tax=Gossypium barbadense TaxID=3634 RepID=A0A2P5WAL7_GOSBA|nr:hypothetical protein GOBAR_AA32569 [Gossypium barbadense]